MFTEGGAVVADQAVAGGPDWARYYAATVGHEPRPLLRAACELLGAGAGRTAIDLGCGSGDDALALLAWGWSVVAVDQQPAGLDLLRDRVPAHSAGQVQIVCASFTEATLPRAHLIHASYSLPFCAPGDFPDAWAGIRRALAPGGIFAGQLFGIHDSWAATRPYMSFHRPGQARQLLEGLQVLRLEETERDGTAVSGPKHWHVYDILARQPLLTGA
jgi:SAM-dependent methyltransferase